MGRLVVIESPYAGDIEYNVDYARQCLRDSLERGEAPFASHLLYTQPGVLDDGDSAQRALGLAANFDWSRVADVIVFYIDHGMTSGMRNAYARAKAAGHATEFRNLLRQNRQTRVTPDLSA